MLNNFNPIQLDAINSMNGPVLVLAGAGTGKTKVLVSRVANIVSSGLAVPSEIMCVTFTNKASKEMRNRLSGLIGENNVLLGTFHSICAKWLREYYHLAGLKSNFTIVDEAEKTSLLKSILESCGIEGKADMVKMFSKTISTIKEKGLMHNDDVSLFLKINQNIAEVYQEYQRKLLSYNLVDFDDLMLYIVNILETNKDVLDSIHSRIRYILVDEYQDTNFIQHKMLLLLAQKHKNICCVGDEDQSIYGWRGAQIQNILNFPQHFDGTKIVKLEQNYRSTNAILQVASAVIENNKSRYGKTLFSGLGVGEKVKITKCVNNDHEGRVIVEQIKKLQEDYGMSCQDMAILVRSASQMRYIEESLLHNQIPYKIIDGVRFYDRKEVKDMICYLRLIFSDTDISAFARIVNVPKRGIGDKGLDAIIKLAEQNSFSVTEGCKIAIRDGVVSAKARESLELFVVKLEQWRRYMTEDSLDGSGDTISLSALMEAVINESGYIEMLEEGVKVDPDERVRIENIKDLVTSLQRFDSMEQFLEEVVLFNAKDSNEDENAVSILTMHAAKGLEYEAVFLPAWEQGLFPSARSIEDRGSEGEEEERRLAYVAITRAKKFAFISFTKSRHLYGAVRSSSPSIFVGEIQSNANKDNFVYLDLAYIAGDSAYSNYGYSGGYEKKYSGDFGRIVQSKDRVIFNSEVGSQSSDQARSCFSSGLKKDFAKSSVSVSLAKPKEAKTLETKSFSGENYGSADSFKLGDLVSHKSLGGGKILQIIGHYANVEFEDSNRRLVNKQFLTKTNK